MMDSVGMFALFLAVGATAVSLLWGPVGQALARRIGGRSREPATGLSTGEMAAERIAEVEARLAELEAHHARMLELEERLDFAERLLTQGRPDPVADPDVITPR